MQLPRLTLALLLALAVCITAGGVLVARREVETRLERDRISHRALANSLQSEVRRLEELYQSHLERTGATLTQIWRDSNTPRQLAETLTGIQRVSWLYWRSASPETHLSIGFPPATPLPEPTLEKEHTGLPRPRVLLDAKMLFRDAAGESSGWIDEPGKPLLFYAQKLGTTVVLTLDRAAVRDAMTSRLRGWKDLQTMLTGPDVFRTETGDVLHTAGTLPATPPDVIMPIVSRFGSWQLASWDQREIRAAYHMPTLAGSMALGVLVALGGLSLSAQQRRAAKIAAQRVSFVNRVSHELRTPMTNILLNLDVIEENVPQAGAGRFSLIREEAGRLSRLIENVLTFSRKEEGRLKLQNAPCRPVEVVNRVLSQFEPALARRGISITRTHDGPQTEISLDADALSQITANLLSNVEKYAPEAPATLHTVQNDHDFILTVTDNGPGIAEPDAQRVFEPFERLDDRITAGVSGTGLGLSIARDLATRMGGTLVLRSATAGACFELKVPVEATHHE
ncbi:MAG: HAMP domain-containing histidine kinase [Verrucomicrobiaceae bacterium]|nr:HAMP domain-containing histidine kinase [Verrucomicrobiaceae bacterium]